MNTQKAEFVLSRVLYQFDPANTCCVENDALDEYVNEATQIIHSIESDNTLDMIEVIQDCISTRFGVELSDDIANDIIHAFFAECRAL